MSVQLPPPEGTTSMFAAWTLDGFEQVLAEENPVRPDDAPEELVAGVYAVGDRRVVHPSGLDQPYGHQALLAEHTGTTDKHIWIPAGTVDTWVGDYMDTTAERLSYLLGRLVDRGNTRQAKVHAAIYGFRQIGLDDYVVEYIADKPERFMELTGWLTTINNANAAKNAQNVGHSALGGA